MYDSMESFFICTFSIGKSFAVVNKSTYKNNENGQSL